jgi:hypothetical protein
MVACRRFFIIMPPNVFLYIYLCLQCNPMARWDAEEPRSRVSGLSAIFL